MGVINLRDDGLTITYCEQRIDLASTDTLTFGRRADLVIDENPFMHRIVGRFVRREQVWWLQNQGSAARLRLHDPDGLADLVLVPGQQLPLTSKRFDIRFAAGPTNYELSGSGAGSPLVADETGQLQGTATIEFGSVPLSPEQHLLLVALYESSQRGDGSIEGNSVIANRLGWTAKKFHRKLDTVCEKLHQRGVRGIKGSPGVLAESRRSVLVAHALNAGLVGPGDLGLLRATPVDAQRTGSDG